MRKNVLAVTNGKKCKRFYFNKHKYYAQNIEGFLQ